MALSTAALDESLSAFLDGFPTPLSYNPPESDKNLWVFWNEELGGSAMNSSAADAHTPPMPYINIIKSAFSNLKFDGRGCLIAQLWAPTVTIGGRRLLSTSNQPFAIASPFLGNEGIKRYRLRCMDYQYNIHVNNHNLHNIQQEEEEEGNPMILSGGPAAAFLNRMAEFAYLKDHQGSPLARYALEECGLTSCLMLPICSPSQTSSSCIAVVECIFEYGDEYTGILARMKKSLEEAGLSIYHVQERIPYEKINGLKAARDDIAAALKIVCGSHNLQLAQVWITYVDENHEPFSSSMVDTRMKHMTTLKLTGYLEENGFLSSFGGDNYYNMCDVVHLEARKELVEETLTDYKLRFFENVSSLGDYMLFTCALPEEMDISGVSICLRSFNTGNLDYAFEFVWLHTSSYVMLLEAILLTLKRCLPSFKFASGAQLDEELEFHFVDGRPESDIDTDAEAGDQVSPLAIALEAGKKPMVVGNFEAKRQTTPKELRREDIEKQFGNTMEVAAKNLNVSLSKLKRYLQKHHIYEGLGNMKKRKMEDSSNDQSNRNVEDYGVIHEPSIVNKMENTLTIKANYEDDKIIFKLHISEATFVNVEKEIGVNFNLALGTFKLKYFDEDEDWILLKSDQNMMGCLESMRISGRPKVQLRVIQFAK